MSQVIPGQTVNVDAHGRLTVPVDVLKGAPWWSGKTRIAGELTQRGLLRAYPDSAVSGLRHHEDREPETEAAFIRRATLSDKYRTLVGYAEGRLQLTKEICPWLGFTLGHTAQLYAQPLHRCLEIMSMEFRFARLAELEAFPLIGDREG